MRGTPYRNPQACRYVWDSYAHWNRVRVTTLCLSCVSCNNIPNIHAKRAQISKSIQKDGFWKIVLAWLLDLAPVAPELKKLLNGMVLYLFCNVLFAFQKRFLGSHTHSARIGLFKHTRLRISSIHTRLRASDVYTRLGISIWCAAHEL